MEIENSGYNDMGTSGWEFGNQFNSMIMKGQEATVWEDTEKMNNEALKSPMLGFVPNTDPVTNELANLSSVGGEFNAKVRMGTADASEWLDDYLKKRDQAGVRVVQEEVQKQYDEFLASKK